MIKAIIADDEQHAIDRLLDLLSEFTQIKILAISRDGTEALENMISHEPDVAFLDINMPGISVLKSLGSLANPPLIVFQTAHSKYAAEAFDLNAVDYLMKPYSKERLGKAIEKIEEKLNQNRNAGSSISNDQDKAERLAVKLDGAIRLFNIPDIHKICFEEGLCFLYTKQDRYLTDYSLTYFEEKLTEKGFFRTNRANLINLKHVSTIHKGFKGSYFVEMTDGSRVELSRRKAQLLKQQLEF